MKNFLQPASTSDNNGYASLSSVELTEIKIESAQPAEQAERPLIPDVMSIVALCDIDSLSRLNEWRQELPQAVASLTRKVDNYLDKNPRLKNLCKLFDASESKKTEQQDNLESAIKGVLECLDGEPLPQQIECLQAVLDRRFEQNKSVSDVHEDKVSLLDERKEDSALFEQNGKVNSVYQSLQKFYSEKDLSSHTNFIDWVILNCLILKAFLGARVAGEGNQRNLESIAAEEGKTAASLTAQEQKDESRRSCRFFAAVCCSFAVMLVVGVPLYADGLNRESKTEQNAAMAIGLIFGSLAALFLYCIKERSVYHTAQAAETARNRSGLFRAVAVRTAALLETKPDEQKESALSPRSQRS